MFIGIGWAVRLTLLLAVMIGTSSNSHAQSSVSPEQANAFVRAALAVSEVHETWQVRINRAKSEVEAERLREKSLAAMRQAIQGVDGMTMEQYRVVYYEAKRNPELASYLIDILEKEVAAAGR